MRKKLTAKTVEALVCTSPKRIQVWDVALLSFGIRVSPNGHKSWFCSARVDGRQRRITIGPYPRLSLSDAREAARKIMTNARHGTVAQPENDITLGEVVPQFIERYAKPKNRNWRESERILNQKFRTLFGKRLRAITRPDIVRLLDDMVAKGIPGRANHALAAIKKLMNWTLDQGMIEVNPITGLSPRGKTISRERILTDQEIPTFLEAAECEGYPFGCVYMLLLLTGQRRGEVSGMRWSELDLPQRTWAIPAARSKNGVTHQVPLSEPVLEIIHSVPRFLGSDYVFTTTVQRAQTLKNIGIDAETVPIGYHPCWGQKLSLERDIDVLSIGTLKIKRYGSGESKSACGEFVCQKRMLDEFKDR